MKTNLETKWTPLAKKRLGCVFVVVLFLLVSFYEASRRMTQVDFVITNGDFQTYNVLRRFLEGQIPYFEFSNYLGAAPLFCLAPLLLFQNTFAGSLFVSHFVSALFFMLFVWLVFYLITKQFWLAGLAAVFIPLFTSTKLFLRFVPHFGYPITHYFELLLYPGNSVRILRMGLMLVFAFLLLVYAKRNPTRSLQQALLSPRFLCIAGFLAGLGLTWSNDFGFAVLAAASGIVLAVFAAYFFQKANRSFKHFFGLVFAWFGSALCGGLVSILLITRFHPLSWLIDTVQIGQWQYWYFGTNPNEKITHILQLFFLSDVSFVRRSLFLIALSCLFFLLWLYWLVTNKMTNHRLIYSFLVATINIAALGYMYGSGNFHFEEGLICLFLLSSMALIVLCVYKGILKVAPMIAGLPTGVLINRCTAGLLSVSLLLVSYVSYTHFSARTTIDTENPHYVPALGGVTQYAPALEEMANVVGDSPLFSSYATAPEVVLDTQQPTGSDYIIHALGEDSFEAYLHEFETGDYPFALTTNLFSWPWEAFQSNVVKNSWPFYKTLYERYSVQGIYGDWMLWQQNPPGETNTILANNTVSMRQTDPQTVEIEVNSDATQPGLMAHLSVHYTTQREWNLFSLQTFRTATYVHNELSSHSNNRFDGYFIPNEAAGRPLMVELTNGSAHIQISSLPAACTTLQVDSVTVSDRLYFVNST